MHGMVNPSFSGLTYDVWTFHFPFSNSKDFFKCTTFKFWKFITVHISEIKESGTCQK